MDCMTGTSEHPSLSIREELSYIFQFYQHARMYNNVPDTNTGIVSPSLYQWLLYLFSEYILFYSASLLSVSKEELSDCR